MHLGGLEDDARGRGVGETGGGAEKRVEAVDGKEVAEPVDAEVAVDVVRVDVVLVCVYSGAAYQLYTIYQLLGGVKEGEVRTRSSRFSFSLMRSKTSFVSCKFPRSHPIHSRSASACSALILVIASSPCSSLRLTMMTRACAKASVRDIS